MFQIQGAKPIVLFPQAIKQGESQARRELTLSSDDGESTDMLAAQVLINALVLGCLYACIAIGFSLVWGVLNVINLIHGSFIVLGAYLAWGAVSVRSAISPWYALVDRGAGVLRARLSRCSGCCSIASSPRRCW